MGGDAPDLVSLLASQTAASMMPGLALPGDHIAPAQAAPAQLQDELTTLNLVRALQRVTTWPGSGDLDFIGSLRGRRFHLMTDAERERLLVLSWRYRAQLPEGLRAHAEPVVPRRAASKTQ